MATLICYKEAQEFSVKFRAGGMDFDLSRVCDSLNRTYFDGEIKISDVSVFIPNPKTPLGLKVVEPMGIEAMARTDGKRISIHPMLTMNPFPLDASLIVGALTHELVHVLGFQRYGRLHDHESFFFGSTVAQINERLGLPEPERDQLKHWPTFPIPLFDILAHPLRVYKHAFENRRNRESVAAVFDDVEICAPLGDHFIEITV